MDNYLGIL
ncbi:hypothetical protein RDI58_009468 [Solanum bulbocastanum]|uniref:Uncharacterized protein n=1 Tax=Solanum bulbocastanum TaxID=147425 RepID=A0AAN8U3Y5_SOLBU